MTICVARQFGKRVLLSSDTAISSLVGRKRTALGGALKCWRITPNLAVAYAGNPHVANDVLATMIRGGLDGGSCGEVCSTLVRTTVGGAVDFLVVSHSERGTEIAKVTDGNVSLGLPAAHIGSHAAFSRIQERVGAELAERHGQALGQFREESAFSAGFASVIGEYVASGSDDVGGFAITMVGDGKSLWYQLGSAVFVGMPMTIRTSRTPVPVPFGNASTGAYAVSICTPAKGDNAIAVGVYHPFGRVGTLYAPLLQPDVDEPFTISEVTHDEFVDAVRSRYGIALSGMKLSGG